MVSEFPITIHTNNKIKVVHSAMPSALEGAILDEPVVLSWLMLVAAVLSMSKISLNAHRMFFDNSYCH